MPGDEATTGRKVLLLLTMMTMILLWLLVSTIHLAPTSQKAAATGYRVPKIEAWMAWSPD